MMNARTVTFWRVLRKPVTKKTGSPNMVKRSCSGTAWTSETHWSRFRSLGSSDFKCGGDCDEIAKSTLFDTIVHTKFRSFDLEY
jgi:hypothetical protein